MAKESEFVDLAMEVAESILAPPLSVHRGEALLYQATVNNELEVTVDPRRPKRGNSAFQTDLCIFEEREPELRIPRVVMEFKPRITTHDVLTYSAKARKHKQVYPYLRYGLIVSGEPFIPGRVFTHNEALDFCATLEDLGETRLRQLLASLLQQEVDCSRRLEKIFFSGARAFLFRTDVVVNEVRAKVS